MTSRPPPRVPLIGRERELRLIRESMEAGAPLVTLTGPPGVGKTTAALHAMSDAAQLGAGWRIVSCDLADAREARDLHQAIARALMVPVPSTDEDAAPRLVEALTLAPTWLLLDNFDRLVATAAAAVADLVAEVAELQIVVTSRQRLGIEAEHVVEIAPLGLPAPGEPPDGSDAVRLFLERARAAGAHQAWTAPELASIAKLVRELDGLPLAIELAAARCNLLGPDALLARLHDRFELLRKARPAALDLRVAIETSWELLTAEERSALAACSVFRGSFSIEAAERVTGASVDTIQSLRDKSLIAIDRFGSRRRLTLLLSIRSFVESRLGADEAKVREGHARWCVETAVHALAEVDGPRAAQALAVLHANYDNLCAACDRSPGSDNANIILLALCKLDRLSDFRVALVDRLDAALACTADRDASLVEVQLLIEHGLRLDQQGKLERAEEQLDRAKSQAERLGASREEGRALRLLSEISCSRGQLDRAKTLAMRALQVAEATNDDFLRAYAEDGLGFVELYGGHPTAARSHCERALETFRRLGNAFEQLPVLVSLTFIHASLGDAVRTRAQASEGLRLHDQLGVARSSLRLALAAAVARAEHAAGELDAACRGYEENARLAAVIGYRRLEAYARAYLGIARFEQGAAAEGRLILREALPLLSASGDVHYGAFLRATLGAMEALDGDLAEAERLLREAEGAFEQQDESPLPYTLAAYRCLLAAAPAPDIAASLAAADEAAANQRGGSVGLFEIALARRIVEGRRAPAPKVPRGRIVIAVDGSWFEPPAGVRVRCGKRPVMRRMIVALAQAHRERRTQALSHEQLLRAGWPGERVIPHAARRRLQVMVARMRDLGLREVLETTDGGYRLSPDVDVEQAEAEDDVSVM